jgi:uncharacterized membrane protein YgdD (TMEM256/DUF423 family)
MNAATGESDMTDRGIGGRAALLGAGLLGFGGVAASAAGAHSTGDPRLLGAAALICLTHAPALLAFGLSGRRGVMPGLAAGLLFAGAALFSGDLALRDFGYGRLFAMAAPTGGVILMAGWLAVALTAFSARRASADR